MFQGTVRERRGRGWACARLCCACEAPGCHCFCRRGCSGDPIAAIGL